MISLRCRSCLVDGLLGSRFRVNSGQFRSILVLFQGLFRVLRHVYSRLTDFDTCSRLLDVGFEETWMCAGARTNENRRKEKMKLTMR